MGLAGVSWGGGFGEGRGGEGRGGGVPLLEALRRAVLAMLGGEWWGGGW